MSVIKKLLKYQFFTVFQKATPATWLLMTLLWKIRGRLFVFGMKPMLNIKKNSKSLTWQEFKGKYFIKAENRAQLEGRIKRCKKKI